MPLKDRKPSRYNQSKRASPSKQPRPKDASAAGTPLKENELSSKKLRKIQQLIYKDTQPFGLAATAREEPERDPLAKAFR